MDNLGDVGKSTSSERSESKLSKLITLLSEENLSGIGIAETLWLSLQMEKAETPTQSSVEPKTQSLPLSTIRDEFASQSEDQLVLDQPEPEPPVKKKKVDVAVNSKPQAKLLPTEILPVWIADPGMLCDPLKVMRALRPLFEQVETGTKKRLDEPATVDNIARSQLWLPVLQPELTPRFDIVLVVDRGASMHLWERLVRDLTRTFRRYGVFRRLQVFDIDIDPNAAADDKVRLKAHPERRGHRPSEIIEQQGRRIVVVLSDCAGEYWWDGTLVPMMKQWAEKMPTVIWQMLPEWMWARTALGQGQLVALRNGEPGVANQRLQQSFVGREGRRARREARRQKAGHESATRKVKQLPVPVVTGEPRDLRNWSAMLMGDRRERSPGFLLPVESSIVSSATLAQSNEPVESYQCADTVSEAEQREAVEAQVQRFWQLASPEAKQLAGLLAAAPVITLPVMRLIRNAMLRDSDSPLPVAEVFLSGLIEQIAGQEETSKNDYDTVQYSIPPLVREVLLKKLPSVTKIDVLNRVSSAIESRWNAITPESFQAFLTNPDVQAPESLGGLRAFGSVAAEILKSMGSRYEAFADKLQQVATGSDDADDFEVPPLETLRFQQAVIRETETLVQLVMDTFEVATIQRVEGVVLEAYEFETARLQDASRSSSQFGRVFIHRTPKRAYQLVEPLSAMLTLDMVAIPAGQFSMGSHSLEKGHKSTESPQHQVSVDAFLMGKYPVTQAQWRFVASLDRYKVALTAEPADFKGNNLPVENVSFWEAMEFCYRLSVYTGNNYRLPKEAEWEYACRAETTTPFHFGPTISTELANYNGIEPYEGNQRGRYQQRTTPVGEFGLANGFGLYDMHGNVWEWCVDHWHNSYVGASPVGHPWQTTKNSDRVIRGGAWHCGPMNCRSASRDRTWPTNKDYGIGFRVCCTAT